VKTITQNIISGGVICPFLQDGQVDWQLAPQLLLSPAAAFLGC
jgi:hypothetical protein